MVKDNVRPKKEEKRIFFVEKFREDAKKNLLIIVPPGDKMPKQICRKEERERERKGRRKRKKGKITDI